MYTPIYYLYIVRENFLQSWEQHRRKAVEGPKKKKIINQN